MYELGSVAFWNCDSLDSAPRDLLSKEMFCQVLQTEGFGPERGWRAGVKGREDWTAAGKRSLADWEKLSHKC